MTADEKSQITQWFLQNYCLVMSLAFSYAPSPDLAPDIAQGSYLELIQEDIGSLETERLTPLLRLIVRRVAQRHWDELQRKTPEKLEKIARHLQRMTSEKEETYHYDEELVALRKCLAKLQDKKRFLIEQHYFMKRTSRSIAEQFGISRDAVANAIFRIRKSLKTCIRLSLEADLK